MQTKLIERYFFFGLFLATFVFTFMIFQPFWIVILLGIAFSIVLYPIYKWLVSKHLPSWLSSLLTVILFAFLLLGPLSGIGILIFKQSQNVYQSLTMGDGIGPFVNSIGNTINEILPEGVNFDLKQKVADFVIVISQNIAKIFSTTLEAFLSFTLILLSMFYFIKDGPRWRTEIVNLSPLSDEDDRKIIARIETAVNGVVKGYLLIAILQGILMGIGLTIFGVPNGALWGVVAAVASLVPMIGTAFVSIPAIIYLLAMGDTVHAIGFVIWATLIVGLVDNFLNPLIISGKIQIPPIFILFAVLGGISLLGPIGVLVGPLTVSVLYTLTSIYKNEFKDSTV